MPFPADIPRLHPNHRLFWRSKRGNMVLPAGDRRDLRVGSGAEESSWNVEAVLAVRKDNPGTFTILRGENRPPVVVMRR